MLIEECPAISSNSRAKTEQRCAESKAIILPGMDEEAALSCVTNTTYNVSSQVKFPQLIKGKYNDTFILLTVMILKIKSFKVFLSLQDQASC